MVSMSDVEITSVTDKPHPRQQETLGVSMEDLVVEKILLGDIC